MVLNRGGVKDTKGRKSGRNISFGAIYCGIGVTSRSPNLFAQVVNPQHVLMKQTPYIRYCENQDSEPLGP